MKGQESSQNLKGPFHLKFVLRYYIIKVTKKNLPRRRQFVSLSLDRFSQGPPDPADAKVVAYCEGCGGEIYGDEDIYVVGNAILHYDWECLERYVDPVVTKA